MNSLVALPESCSSPAQSPHVPASKAAAKSFASLATPARCSPRGCHVALSSDSDECAKYSILSPYPKTIHPIANITTAITPRASRQPQPTEQPRQPPGSAPVCAATNSGGAGCASFPLFSSSAIRWAASFAALDFCRQRSSASSAPALSHGCATSLSCSLRLNCQISLQTGTTRKKFYSNYRSLHASKKCHVLTHAASGFIGAVCRGSNLTSSTRQNMSFCN